MDFANIKAIISDMDGVLWRGDVALPGARAFFDLLAERQLPYALATNNSSKTPDDYVQKLAKLGMPDVPARAIVTSGTATAAYLKKHYAPGTPMHVFGSAGLHHLVSEAGFTLTNDGDARAVVAGIKWELTYDDLKRAAFLIQGGADFIGTNPDTTFPTPEGPAPGTGSMLAALEAATGVTPVIIGKPHPHMFEAALDTLGTPPAATLMIGDRLNTDITGAVTLGLRTALVLTGISTAADLADSPVQPDAVYPDLPSLIQALRA
jgi:4-nitrophenyl phosphatase